MTARDSALQRGHVLPEHPVRVDEADVWICDLCGLRAVSYQDQEYGEAIATNCRGMAG